MRALAYWLVFAFAFTGSKNAKEKELDSNDASILQKGVSYSRYKFNYGGSSFLLYDASSASLTADYRQSAKPSLGRRTAILRL